MTTIRPVLPEDVKVPSYPCGARLKRPRDDGRLTCSTLVIGGGPCRMHGGAAPQVRRKREQRIAVIRAQLLAQAQVPGLPPASPDEVLLQELDRTREQVTWLEGMVQNEEPAAGMTLADTVAWLVKEREHQARLAADCVRLDLAGRRQSVMEREADSIVKLIKSILVRVGFDPDGDREVRQIVSDELLAAGEGRQVYRSQPDPGFRVAPRQLPPGGGS